jgi:hypothetical protein
MKLVPLFEQISRRERKDRKLKQIFRFFDENIKRRPTKNPFYISFRMYDEPYGSVTNDLIFYVSLKKLCVTPRIYTTTKDYFSISKKLFEEALKKWFEERSGNEVTEIAFWS